MLYLIRFIFFRQKFDSEGGGKNLSLTGVCVCVFFLVVVIFLSFPQNFQYRR